MTLAAGQLRDPLVVECFSTTYDDGGEPTEEWTALKPHVWGDVTPLSGLELIRAQKIEPNATHEVRLRFDPDITTDCRFVFKGRFLNIEHVRDEDSMEESMFCLCKELV